MAVLENQKIYEVGNFQYNKKLMVPKDIGQSLFVVHVIAQNIIIKH